MSDRDPLTQAVATEATAPEPSAQPDNIAMPKHFPEAPEAIAFLLMKAMLTLPPGQHREALDLYAECLQAAYQKREPMLGRMH